MLDGIFDQILKDLSHASRIAPAIAAALRFDANLSLRSGQLRSWCRKGAGSRTGGDRCYGAARKRSLRLLAENLQDVGDARQFQDLSALILATNLSPGRTVPKSLSTTTSASSAIVSTTCLTNSTSE